MVLDSLGNIYGTTAFGGSGCAAEWCGVVFKLTASGEETVLYNFTDGPDGGYPYTGVVLDGSGNLYGTAVFGGTTGGGVWHKIVP